MPGDTLTIQFRHGRKPPHSESARPRLKLAQFLTGTLPPVPANVDYLSKVTDWPMYGNDQYGDCVWAMIGHTIEAATTYGQGHTVKITDADVIKGYSDVTGFDPADPSTDQGTVIQDALSYWRKTGVGGHKILAFAQVDVKNPAEVGAALYLFGHLQLGINFPASAMDQFNAGQPWDVVKHTQIEGGHATDYGANDEAVTWARRQKMTPAFWDTYVEEAWVAITPEWYDAQGRNPEGVDVTALGEAFTSITGEPSPFRPSPQPTPTPTPVPPGPAPVPVDAADQALADTARPWLEHRHSGPNRVMAKSLLAWIEARGL